MQRYDFFSIYANLVFNKILLITLAKINHFVLAYVKPNNDICTIKFKQTKKLFMETLTISSTARKVINALNKAVKASPTGVSFVAINKYTNSSNEVSNNLINIGASYANAKKSDIEFLENLKFSDYEFKSELSVLETAKAELIAAFIKPDENRSKGQIEAYTTICSGIKVHNETGVMYVYGYRQNKTILQTG